MRPASLLLLFFFYTTSVFSQPNPRHLEEVAYDKIRNRLILFGGAELVNGRPEEPSMYMNGTDQIGKDLKHLARLAVEGMDGYMMKTERKLY